jgi:hypothetical protein
MLMAEGRLDSQIEFERLIARTGLSARVTLGRKVGDDATRGDVLERAHPHQCLIR